MNMKRLTIIITWLVLCVPALAAPPASVNANYEVFSNGMKIGQVDEVYSRDKDHYTLTSTTTPLGLLAIFKPEKVFASSNGLITQQGLRPVHYAYQREGDAGKSVSAELDWATRQLTLTTSTQRAQLPLPDGTQDRLSAMYQFMFLNLENVTSLDFAMTNGSKLDNYHYAIGDTQKLNTPAGQFDCRHLDSQAKPGEHRTELWLATRHHNLPCRMIVTDPRGEQLTQVLSSLKIVP